MKFLIIFCLLSLSAVVNAELEWQYFFPDKAAVVDGQYIDSNQALVIKSAGGEIITEGFDLATITDFNIPDNASVTGFTIKRNTGSSLRAISYLFSLSVATGDYVKGDVIECNYDGCGLFVALGSHVSITGLDYDNESAELLVSFENGFNANNAYLSPQKVYLSSDFSLIYDGTLDGLGDNNAITALDTSGFNLSFSPLSMFDSNEGLVKASEVYGIGLDVNNELIEELSEEISGLVGYYSVDSGWAEFEDTVVNVSEAAGFVEFKVLRTGGSENRLSVITVASNGTAIDGVDYNNFASQLNWNDDENQVFTSTVISLIDNNQVDDTRTFTINLIETSNDFHISLINPIKSQITVNIIDDDGDLIFADGFE